MIIRCRIPTLGKDEVGIRKVKVGIRKVEVVIGKSALRNSNLRLELFSPRVKVGISR